MENLTHGYSDKKLFDNVDLTIEKGERVAIIGPNGETFFIGVFAGLTLMEIKVDTLCEHGVFPGYLKEGNQYCCLHNMSDVNKPVRS